MTGSFLFLFKWCCIAQLVALPINAELPKQFFQSQGFISIYSEFNISHVRTGLKFLGTAVNELADFSNNMVCEEIKSDSYSIANSFSTSLSSLPNCRALKNLAIAKSKLHSLNLKNLVTSAAGFDLLSQPDTKNLSASSRRNKRSIFAIATGITKFLFGVKNLIDKKILLDKVSRVNKLAHDSLIIATQTNKIAVANRDHIIALSHLVNKQSDRIDTLRDEISNINHAFGLLVFLNHISTLLLKYESALSSSLEIIRDIFTKAQTAQMSRFMISESQLELCLLEATTSLKVVTPF